ncbi:MAG: type II toxin-antitoxin system prevent-host-death family antitoxin [Chloroflexi bacterium]|nr:type II toxin-antitoxin system prevent-host-death family antitoxin [Chloroflexota bacterium]
MTVKIIPISEMRRRLRDILARLEATGEPYFITQYSRPKAVLVRYEDYNALVEQAAWGHSHITSRPGVSGGEPIIRGTRISVRHIVERSRSGQSVEEILAALSGLTAAGVYDALSYYYDHQPEMDQLLEESRPERVMPAHRLKAERVAEGVAVIHDDAGRW